MAAGLDGGVAKAGPWNTEVPCGDPSVAVTYSQNTEPSWPLPTARGDPPTMGQPLCTALQLGGSSELGKGGTL